MEQSILKSTKKNLQVALDDESFDLDIITQINSAFSTLTGLGVGPDAGFFIEDDTETWEAFLSDNPIQLGHVKDFVRAHAKLRFDPPQTPFLLNALQEQLTELTWRLNVNRESTEWVDPMPPVVVVDE